MTNTSVTNPNESGKPRYVAIGDEHVYLNPAQQKVWDKFINDTRNEARRKGTCSQPDFHLCFGDCERCPYKVAGKMISMDDGRYGDGFSIGPYAPADKPAELEDVVAARITLEIVMNKAALLERNGDHILRLRLEEGLSTHKIADRLDMRQSTVNDELNRLLRFFREHRSDFI